MEPALPVGSIVIAERVRDAAALRVGDIVTYKNPAVPFTITHRIVEVTEEGFVTKGDNIKENDGEIPKKWVKYKVTGSFVQGACNWSGNEVKGRYAGVISSKRPYFGRIELVSRAALDEVTRITLLFRKGANAPFPASPARGKEK